MALSLIAAAVTRDMRADLAQVSAATDAARAEALADGAVMRVLVGLSEPEPDRRWGGGTRSFEFPEGRVAVSIEDEAGRVDLNVASDRLVLALFERIGGVTAGEAEALLGRLKDYRDEDDHPSPQGAEAAEYRAAGLPWGPRNAPLQAVVDLQRMLGMTPELYARLEPWITVHSRQRGIDPGVAAPEILELLPGVSEDALDQWLDARDDRPMGRPSGVSGQYIIRAPGRAFTIRARAETAGGAVFVREALVVLTRMPEKPWILYDWRRASTAGGSDRPGR